MWIIGLACDGCGTEFQPPECPLEDLPDFDEVRRVAIRHAAEDLAEDLAEDPPGWVIAAVASHEACRVRSRIAAGRMGWEQVDSPDDGEEWFCPTCRLARDREALMPDVGRAAAG
jgi:hypothetical protein